MDRVALIVELTGDKAAYTSLHMLKQLATSLNGMHIKLHVDGSDITDLIKAVKETTRSTNKVKVDSSEVKQLQTMMSVISAEIRKLTNEKKKLRADGQDYERIDRTITELQGKLADLNQEKVELRADATSWEIANDIINDVKNNIGEAAEATVSLSDKLSVAGEVLNALGAASGKLGDFATGIGQSFAAMSGIFSSDFSDKMMSRVAEVFTDGVFGNLNASVSRYDILNTFEQYMELAGVSSNDAADALQRVNDAILGLPIGLDEAAQRLRRYQMYLGDVTRATNLTIGVQNALFAGGANEAARTTAYYQIDRLLTVGKLNTARQWNALLVGLGVSTRYIAEEMGYSYKNISDFATGLSKGTISTDEFLRALERLGTGTTAAGQRLASALGIYRGTIESWLENIRFAFKRGGANLLTALDEALSSNTGKGITGYLERIRAGINEFYKAGEGFIKNRPEVLNANVTAMTHLFDSLHRFSGSDLAAGVMTNMAKVIDLVAQALNRLPAGETERFVAFATTLAGPLSKLFKAAASGMGVVLGVFERFKDFDFSRLLDKILTQVELMAKVVSGLLNMIPDGLMGDIIAFGLVWGKPLAAVLTSIGGAVTGLGVALEAAKLDSYASAFSEGGFFGGLIRFAQMHPTITAAAKALGVFAAALVGFRMFYDRAQDAIAAAKEDTAKGIERIRNEYGGVNMASLSNGFNGFVNALTESSKAFAEETDKIEFTASKAEELSKKILELDDRIRISGGATREALEGERGVAIQQLEKMIGSLGLTVDEGTYSLDANSRALLENGSALETWLAKARSTRDKQRIDDLTTAQLDAEQALASLKESRLENDSLRQELKARADLAYNQYLSDGWKYQMRKGPDGKPIINPNYEEYLDLTNRIKEIDQENARIYVMTRLLEGGLSNTSKQLRELIKNWDELSESEKAAMEEAVKNQWWADAVDSVDKMIGKQLEGFERLEKASKVSAQNIKTNLQSQADAANEYADSIDEVVNYIKENGVPGLDGILGKMAEQGLDATGMLLGIAEAIRNGDDAAVQKIVDAYEEKVAAAARAKDYTIVAEAIAQGLGNADLEKAFASVGEDGAHLLLQWIGLDNPEATGEKLARQIERAIEYAKTGIDPLSKTKFTIEAPIEIKPISTTSLLPERGNPELPTVKQKMEIDGEAEVKQVIDNTVEAVVTGASSVLEALETLAKDGVGAVESAAEDALSEVEDLEDGVNDVAATKGGVDDLASSMDEIARSAGLAERAVLFLRAALDSLQDKEVNVSVNTTEHVVRTGGGGGSGRTGIFNGPIAVPYATGGSVGTDTIPAILTPGEFVVRKGAVDRLGAAFLGRLNNLDIRGAIDSMMSRYYRPQTIPYAASYTNNSYDNRNVVVNQNIRTNNPHYTYRVASRFANAL